MRRQQSCYGIATGAAQDPACLSSGLPVSWQCSRSAGKGRVGMQLSSACASRAVIGETQWEKECRTFPDYLLRTHSGKHLHTSLSGWLIRAGAEQPFSEGTPTIPASAWGEDTLLFVRHLSFQHCCPNSRFGAGTERAQLAATGSGAAPAGPSCSPPDPAEPGPGKQRPAPGCQERQDSHVPRGAIAGLFPQTNVQFKCL